MKNSDIEPLEFIDNFILSSFDNTNSNENENINLLELMNEKLIPSTTTQSSPILTASSKSISTNLSYNNDTTILLSTTSTNNNDSLVEHKYSTPKIPSIIKKEFELINDLYEKGALNDITQQQQRQQKEEKLTQQTSSFPISPIIANNNKSKLPRLSNNKNIGGNSGLLRKTLTNNLIKSTLLDFNSTLTNNEVALNDQLNVQASSKDDDELVNFNIQNCGFKTAGGKKLSFDPNALKKVKNITDVSDDEIKLNFVQNSAVEKAKTVPNGNNLVMSGFSTAGGKQLAVNANLLENAQKKIEKLNAADNPTKSENSLVMSGFSTAGGKQLSVNANLLENARKKIEKFDTTDEQLIPAKSSNNLVMSGFSTAGGKQLAVNANLLENAQKKIEKLNAADSSLINEENVKLKPNDSNSISSGFLTAGGKNLSVNANLLENAQKKLNEIDTNTLTTNDMNTKIPTPKVDFNNRPRKLGDSKQFKRPQFKTSENKAKNLEEKVSNKENLEDSKVEMNKSKTENKSNNSLLCHYGLKLNTQERNEIELSINTLLLNESFSSTTQPFNDLVNLNQNENKFKIDDNLSSFNIYNKNNCLNYLELINTIEINVDSNKQPNSKIILLKPVFKLCKLEPNIIQNDKILSDEYILKRQLAINELKQRLDTNNTVIVKKQISTLLKTKLINRKSNENKLSLKNLKMEKSLLKSDLYKNVKNIEKLYKFKLVDFYNKNYLNTYGCVKCADGGVLISDDDGFVGSNEFFDCLLDSNGVDRKLINRNWFDNHLKWIIWKLHSYEVKFSDSFKSKVLTPENVMLQLKYRYDVEIDNAKRSCIRRVVERDDTFASRLVILFVSKIISIENGLLFIELSDGWYPIKAQCDTYLTKIFENGKIIVGDKLALFGCEMTGPQDGFPPLEAPPELYIKLSINATRRAKWFAKLGFVVPQRPLCVSLNSLKPGGYVGAIDVIIERIYPITYREKKPDGSFCFHNEKQEQLFADRFYNERNRCFENILNGMGKHSDSDENKTTDNLNKNDLEARLREKMKTNKQTYDRDIKPMLKIRIMDVKFKFSSILTIWQNINDFKEQLIEGTHFKIINLQAAAPKSKYESDSSINLNTCSQTKFIEVKSKSGTNPNHKPRKCYDFQQFYKNLIENNYQEVDTCGFVIHLASNAYQDVVYLANTNKTNCIVCILFPKNSDLFGFKDILKVGELIICLNLKFTIRKEHSRYPSLLATNLSLFTTKISRYRFMQATFEQYQQFLNQIADDTEFFENLSKEITENLTHNTTNTSLINDSMNRQLNNSLNNKSLNNSNINNKSIDFKNSSKTNSISEIAGLPPLIISKNPLRTPGLSSKQQNLKQNRQFNIIYPSKTVKRTSNESSGNKTHSSDENSNLSVHDSNKTNTHDDSFSTQDLRDISNNELLMNSAKRTKF